MSDECVFCKIIRGDFGTEFVAESERAVAFRDIAPAAPVHVLVVPREHIEALHQLEDASLGGELLALARQVALDAGLDDSGFRVITNNGSSAGQTVFHLHFHVIGGRTLSSSLA
ncbi:MAG: histidine triad nucleotide-binding protein [Thermomicrobiales bacterium]|nr:histidine triad nucleotide-binding protein [Thermomicrobiales bacterium]